jgi:hypothetical protein
MPMPIHDPNAEHRTYEYEWCQSSGDAVAIVCTLCGWSAARDGTGRDNLSTYRHHWQNFDNAQRADMLDAWTEHATARREHEFAHPLQNAGLFYVTIRGRYQYPN